MVAYARFSDADSPRMNDAAGHSTYAEQKAGNRNMDFDKAYGRKKYITAVSLGAIATSMSQRDANWLAKRGFKIIGGKAEAGIVTIRPKGRPPRLMQGAGIFYREGGKTKKRLKRATSRWLSLNRARRFVDGGLVVGSRRRKSYGRMVRVRRYHALSGKVGGIFSGCLGPRRPPIRRGWRGVYR